MPQHIGQHVHLQGWVHALRKLGGITFLILRDGWGTVQIIVENEAALAVLQEENLMPESVISVEGEVRATPQAPGGIEIGNPMITVLTPVSEPLPVIISKREINAALPTLLDHAVVANRHPARRALFRLGAGVMAAFRSHLSSRGFTEIQTPKLVASATESGANVFGVDYFGRRAFLAQSPQFYKQVMVGVFERVFEVGPVFRAEPHDTIRHINEYVSLDIEFGFIENHFTVMAMLRDVMAAIFSHLNENYAPELTLTAAVLPMSPRRSPISTLARRRN